MYNMNYSFLAYLVTCALVTYLIRMLPLVLVKKKIKSRFLLSFLYYVPYAVLSAMVIPAIFFATEHIWSAAIGFAVAFLLSLKGKSLLTVSAFSCAAVFVSEIIVKYIN